MATQGNSTDAVPEFAPRWIRWLVFGVFPAVAILQWVLVVPLTRAAGTWWSLEGTGLTAEREVPFLRDFFYMAWNVLPILLWLLTLGILARVRRNLPAIHQRFEPEASRRLLDRFAAIGRSPYALVVIVFLALYACYAQFPKQQGFIENGDCCYWWDKRISVPLFAIRLGALFTNTLLVIYILWRLAVFQVYLAVLSRSGSLSPSFLHADGSCGLKCFGSLSSWLFFPWILVAFVGVAGLLDHGTEQGIHNTVGDLAMTILPVLIALAFFFYPALNISGRLKRARNDVLSDLEPPIERWSRESAWREGANPARLEAEQVLTYQTVSKASTWPFNAAILVRVLMAALAPAITYLLKTLVLR